MHDYAALGVWLLLYLLVLVLMLVATINERDNGAVSDFRLAADTHLLPPPLSFSAGTRHASRVLAEAAGLHAAAAAVRAANSSASSAASGAGKRRTVADGGDGKGSAEFAAGTADSSRADRRQATPSPSAPLSTPVPDTTPPPAQGAAVAAATASVQRRNSAPSAAQISQPQHVWSWLEHLLLPQARLVGQTSECSRATANQRLCAAPPARPPPPGAEGAFYQDGFPGVVMAPLHVRQHRAPRRRWRLPFAGTQEMYDRCLFTKLGAGHVCLNAPEGFNSGLWESPAYGHAQVLQADSFEEYLAKSHNYTRFAYSPARGALDAAAAFMPPFGAWLLFGSGSRDMFGSTYVNFTASGSDGRTGVTFGELAYYPDGGFDLGEAAAIPATPVSGQLYAEQRLNILDPAATACGVPCEGGLRGLALAEWLDSASRSIVLTMSAFSPARNALVCIKALVEFGAGGGAVVSRQVGASRLLSYGGGGLPDGSSEFQTSARLVPEVLWLLCGLVHLALTMVLALYHVHFERIVPKREAAQGAAQARKKRGGIACGWSSARASLGIASSTRSSVDGELWTWRLGSWWCSVHLPAAVRRCWPPPWPASWQPPVRTGGAVGGNRVGWVASRRLATRSCWYGCMASATGALRSWPRRCGGAVCSSICQRCDGCRRPWLPSHGWRSRCWQWASCHFVWSRARRIWACCYLGRMCAGSDRSSRPWGVS